MRRSGEEGAVAITTALILIVLVLVASFLVDLGATRADARTDQLLADSALMAAATFDGGPAEQCEEAIRFLAANVGAGTGYDDSPCQDLAAADPCDPGTTASVTTDPAITVGDFTVTMTYPVDDTDASMSVADQAVDATRDGDRCERIKIEVRRTRDYTFAPVGGAGSSGGSVNDAVALRSITEGNEQYSTMIMLDRTECGALSASGGSQVLVRDLDADHPGLITVDSNGSGSCSGSNGYVMLTNGSNARICAGVETGDVAAIRGGAPCTTPADGVDRIFTPADDNGTDALPADVSSGRVVTDPEDGDRVTRRPADHRWNCLAAYTTATASTPWLPTENDIPSCDEGRDPYIQEAASFLASGSSFTSFGSWTIISGGACNGLSGNVGTTTSNLFLNCATANVAGGDTANLLAEDYIVLAGNLDVSGSLNVSTGTDLLMVFQDGGLATPGTPVSVNLDRVAMYVHQPSFSGADRALNVNLGTTAPAPMTWNAPEGPAFDDDEATPPVTGLCGDHTILGIPLPECFEDLALWSNANDQHILKGLMDVRGVFFTPNAGRDSNTPFDLSGGASQPMERAQFFSYRLNVTGGSSVLMRPDPTSILPTNDVAISLIR